jgi:3-oxoacyl-[acyl-carrier-protein] synthase II
VATHGCATSLGDPAEAAALTAALTPAGRPVAASTVKPATGHLVAAAGALNVALAALAVHHGAVPATLNLGDPDPSCSSPAVEWITGPARDLPVTNALALAQGLEGQSVALTISQSPDPRRLT